MAPPNEHADWETAHHVFTYANAVHHVLKRIGSGAAEAVRGLLHGAMALYLSRYLNVPPASLPGEGSDRLDDLPVVARHLILGHSPETLTATLAPALLRKTVAPPLFLSKRQATDRDAD